MLKPMDYRLVKTEMQLSIHNSWSHRLQLFSSLPSHGSSSINMTILRFFRDLGKAKTLTRDLLPDSLPSQTHLFL